MDPHPSADSLLRSRSTLAAGHLLSEKAAVLLLDRDAGFATAEDREAMLRDADLKKAMAKAIAGRVPDADVEDVLQVALLAAHKAEKLPADPGRRRKYVVGIARKKAAEHRRALRRAPKVEKDADVEEIGPPAPGGSGAAAAGLAEQRDLLEKIVVDLPSSHLLTLEWLARTVMGESFAAIAREACLHEDVVRKRVTTLQRRIIATAATLALVLVFGGFWYALRPKPQIADHPKHPPTTMAPERPATSTQPPVSQLPIDPNPVMPPQPRNAHEEAQPIRDEALDFCNKHEWGECLLELDRAKEIDPDGDRDPAIQAARKQAKKATRHLFDDKPPLPPAGPPK